MTVIGRGEEEREEKSYSFGGSGEILKGKNVTRGVPVLRQGNSAQNSVEQWNIILFIQQILIIFSLLVLIFVFIMISSHSCESCLYWSLVD